MDEKEIMISLEVMRIAYLTYLNKNGEDRTTLTLNEICELMTTRPIGAPEIGKDTELEMDSTVTRITLPKHMIANLEVLGKLTKDHKMIGRVVSNLIILGANAALENGLLKEVGAGWEEAFGVNL